MKKPKVNKRTFVKERTTLSDAKKFALNKSKELINFSFKYLDSSHPSFSFNNHTSQYFREILSRISELSKLSIQELISNRSPSLKSHPIDWEETTQNGFGFPKEDEIVDEPYQFCISRNEHGRIHGFFIGITFYIVWLDKDHRLYSQSH